MNACREAFEQAAARFASVPPDYVTLHIRDNILDEADWEMLNSTFCTCLQAIGCTIVESELDPFWDQNQTFEEMLEYVEENCHCDSSSPNATPRRAR